MFAIYIYIYIYILDLLHMVMADVQTSVAFNKDMSGGHMASAVAKDALANWAGWELGEQIAPN